MNEDNTMMQDDGKGDLYDSHGFFDACVGVQKLVVRHLSLKRRFSFASCVLFRSCLGTQDWVWVQQYWYDVCDMCVSYFV